MSVEQAHLQWSTDSRSLLVVAPHHVYYAADLTLESVFPADRQEALLKIHSQCRDRVVLDVVILKSIHVSAHHGLRKTVRHLPSSRIWVLEVPVCVQ